MNLEPVYQEQLLAVVPKFSGAIGFPSCIMLMREIWLAHHNGLTSGNPILRSLAGIAFFQACDALGWFLSTWAVPEGTFAFAAGNVQTCAFQGFLLQVVIGAPLFCVAMTWYFWMIVVRGKNAEDLVRYERLVSPLIILYSFGSAFYLLGINMYNHIGAVCWVQGSPPSCDNSSFHPTDVPCDRGDWAWLYGMAMFYGPLWCCILAILVLNISIYMKLDDNEEASWFGRQSFFYAIAFVITWAPSTTWSGMHWTADGGSFYVDLFAAFFEPIGGLWNLLTFLQDRPASRKRIMRVICLECFESKQGGEDDIDDYAHKKTEMYDDDDDADNKEAEKTPINNSTTSRGTREQAANMEDPSASFAES